MEGKEASEANMRVNEAEMSVNETGMSVNEAEMSVSEAGMSVSEAGMRINGCLVLYLINGLFFKTDNCCLCSVVWC